jgi:hypothetical protein
MNNAKIAEAITLVAFAVVEFPALAKELNAKIDEAKKSKDMFDLVRKAPDPKPESAEDIRSFLFGNASYVDVYRAIEKFVSEKKDIKFTVEEFCNWSKATGLQRDKLRGRIEYCKHLGWLKFTGKRAKNSKGRSVEVLEFVEKPS